MKPAEVKKLLLILPFIFSGCGGKPMSRQEVIAACKECEDAGMKTVFVQNGLTYKITDVICVPKEK